jgi:hypothetical protein
MSSLENDLADLQNFLIKQSQVRSYEEGNTFGFLAAVLWTQIRICSNPEFFILVGSGSGITFPKWASDQDKKKWTRI